MLKIPDGKLYFLLGKFAPQTGYGRNVENIFNSLAGISNTKIPSKRKARREKIKICSDFTRAFSGTGLFNITFPSFDDTETGTNKATNVIIDQAISNEYPHSRISYPRVLISKGSLPGAKNAAAGDDEEHNILFSWNNNAGDGTAKANDNVILVAYFPAVNKVIYSIDSAIRKDCKAVLETNSMEGHNAETWIGFLSPDEQDAANSRYTGTIYL